MTCLHDRHRSEVVVHHLVNADGSHYGWAADVTISCDECAEPFRFEGLPFGLAVDQPSVSLDGLEMRVPIEPGAWQPSDDINAGTVHTSLEGATAAAEQWRRDHPEEAAKDDASRAEHQAEQLARTQLGHKLNRSERRAVRRRDRRKHG